LPLDGHPVLGFSPARSDVYLAVMHSGVSLAPIVGQLAARELINGVSSGRLDNYRPDRRYKPVKRY
jgi:glycine/D-amino acid oxidase-like deaminating enzyme